ncbi:MAG: hypothetical protein B7X04_03720 [Parcubacteria group bacterium 21-54-25]|nr:MAG: hypothetical protein B7X04_03720 [Parcubacteria group bacterium 21-54-25]HQU08275.1 DUF5652 family protein [Candidatus Paceibacterota bacterium]
MPLEHAPAFLPFSNHLFVVLLPFLVVLLICIIVLKGYALWYSARAGQKWWFIAMLVINTLGILEIVYLLFFRPKLDDGSVTTVPTHNDSHPAP